MIAAVDNSLGSAPVEGLAIRAMVVDDDPAMRQLVVDYLVRHSFRAIGVGGREEMERAFAADDPSLVILDLQLGSEDGLDLLRLIRARSDAPVIVVTGHRREEVDRIVGLELGADDYLTKPFSLRELLARIRAVLRRWDATGAPRRDARRDVLAFGEWVLDRRARRLTDPGGAEVKLTKGEYALLLAFLDAPRRPLTREHLLQATRVHEDVFDRSIDVQILRLRRKLEADPNHPTIIRTERGVGYVFDLPVRRL
jgi:two-component system, OmpR family, response regulator